MIQSSITPLELCVIGISAAQLWRDLTIIFCHLQRLLQTPILTLNQPDQNHINLQCKAPTNQVSFVWFYINGIFSHDSNLNMSNTSFFVNKNTNRSTNTLTHLFNCIHYYVQKSTCVQPVWKFLKEDIQQYIPCMSPIIPVGNGQNIYYYN